jgi:hypothetical protein
MKPLNKNNKMKNIHIIQTDKPSRLRYNLSNQLVLTKESYKVNYGEEANQHIYITSDEDIKEGDWVVKISSLYKGGGNVQKYSFIDTQFEDITFKKIIITTDQSLDGVQAIDDDFLEWFVQNPSCDFVEVEKKSYIEIKEISYEGDFQNVEYINYKIIIPKEEPKQDLEKAIFNLEEELDIPSHLRLHNSKTEQERMYSEEEVDKLLDTLLHNNMCSVAGDELIKQFKKK